MISNSFRVCEFLMSFRRIDFFDHYLVVLEQILEKFLVRFQPPGIRPIATNRVAHFCQVRQTSLGTFFNEHEMLAVRGFHRAIPLADGKVAQFGGELISELFGDFARGRRLDPALQQKRIS